MSLPGNNPNCLGGQMPMANEPGGHPGAQLGQGQEMMQPQQQSQAVALQHHYGHHMGHGADQYGGYMSPPTGVQPPGGPMGPDHHFHGQHQWYVQQHPPHHGGGMMAPPGNPGQQDYRHLPHQQYHQQHHQQQPYHLDMNGAPAGGWNTVQNNVQNNVATAVPITVSNPVPEPVLPIKEGQKDVKEDVLSRTEDSTKMTKKVGNRKAIKAGKVKAKKEDSSGKTKRLPGAASKKAKGEHKGSVEKLETAASGGDENKDEVSAQFSKGCDCLDQNCYDGMDPEIVYKHRLNIDELTKLEHDMYLMGITMACLEGTDETHRHKERKRLRSKYRFKGKEVCLGAFLFLEHTTLHHLKSIRKHVRDHGVTPRIHGNHRKRPHNTFPLDIYQRATKFLQVFVFPLPPNSGHSTEHLHILRTRTDFRQLFELKDDPFDFLCNW